MSKKIIFFLICAVVGPSVGAGVCQQGAGGGAAAGVSSGRVHVDVVVETKAGHPVAGLEDKDFTVLDNKVRQPIVSFAERSGPDAPVEVLLVLDAANAGYSTLAFARDQLKSFLLSNGRELAFPTALAVLTDKGIEMQQSNSRDGNALSASLDRYGVALRSITRSAGFYGAQERLQLSLNGLHQLAAYEATKPGRKIMVWISPGWPLLSGERIDLSNKEEQRLYQEVASTSTELRKARVTMYSIDPLGSSESISRTQYYKQFVKGLSKPGQAQEGDLGLQVLATQTGGFALSSSNDLAAQLKQAVDDGKTFYEISFDPPPADRPDEYHALDVQIAKPGLLARTRQGYYSQQP
jgi:VWFA-related protein